MSNSRKTFWYAWWIFTAILWLGGLVLVLWYTPEARDPLGPVPLQKMFYLHMPSAISTFLDKDRQRITQPHHRVVVQGICVGFNAHRL